MRLVQEMAEVVRIRLIAICRYLDNQLNSIKRTNKIDQLCQEFVNFLNHPVLNITNWPHNFNTSFYPVIYCFISMNYLRCILQSYWECALAYTDEPHMLIPVLWGRRLHRVERNPASLLVYSK
jgi:hypothetical protein